MKRAGYHLSLVILITSWSSSMAQGPKPVSWTVSMTPGTLAADQVGQLRINATIDHGWHIYSATQPKGGPIRTRVAMVKGSVLEEAGELHQGRFETRNDEVFQMPVESFSERASFSLPVRVVSGVSPGKHEALVMVTYQACNGRVCLMPASPILTVKFTAVAPKPDMKANEAGYPLDDRPAPPIHADVWMNSDPLTLQSLRGKVVVLDFWASWCVECREGFVARQALSKKYAKDGLLLIGVTQNFGWFMTGNGQTLGGSGKNLLWSEELELLEQFIRDFKLTTPVAIGRRSSDTGSSAAVRDFGVASFPKGVVIDRAGVVRFLGDPKDARYVEAIVSALSSNRESSRSSH